MEVERWTSEDRAYYGLLALYRVITDPVLFNAIVKQRFPAKGHDNTKGKRKQDG